MAKVQRARGRSSPAGKLLEMIAMRHVPQAIHVVAVLGIADFLGDGAKQIDQIAGATGTEAAVLRRVMRTLVAAGVFAQDKSNRFKLTSLGQRLRSEDPDSVRAAAVFLSGEPDLEGLLLSCVRTGKTAVELASGTTNWIDYYQSDRARAAVFNAGMTALSNAHYKGAVAAYDFRPIHKLVDVGGGHGRLISMILKAYPKMQGVLFDLPHAFEGGRKTVSENGLSPRCEVVSGSFFQFVPEGGDAYLLSRVIHDWDDTKAGAILKVVRKAMPSNGRLLLFETLIAKANELSYPLLSDLNMIIRTGGCERTKQEYRRLYSAAGFKLTRAIATPSPTGMTIIEGRPC